jgi:rubrerythrin
VLLGFGPDAKQQHKDSENSEEIEESDDTEVLRYNESLMQPAPGEKYNWNCASCGYEWADDGVEK